MCMCMRWLNWSRRCHHWSMGWACTWTDYNPCRTTLCIQGFACWSASRIGTRNSIKKNLQGSNHGQSKDDETSRLQSNKCVKQGEYGENIGTHLQSLDMHRRSRHQSAEYMCHCSCKAQSCRHSWDPGSMYLCSQLCSCRQTWLQWRPNICRNADKQRHHKG